MKEYYYVVTTDWEWDNFENLHGYSVENAPYKVYKAEHLPTGEEGKPTEHPFKKYK